MDQVVERLPSKREAQSLNPSTQKKKKSNETILFVGCRCWGKKGVIPFPSCISY
jgi:hypothetical protein